MSYKSLFPYPKLKYLQLQNLLCEFNSPYIINIKIKTKTYLKKKLKKTRKKPKLKKIKINSNFIKKTYNILQILTNKIIYQTPIKIYTILLSL